MKSLSYLNKYFIKYKFRLFMGVFFVIAANIFGIIPAQLVSQAFDLISETITLHSYLKAEDSKEVVYNTFKYNVMLYGSLILLMALLRGVFMYFMRQTIIVMSRLVEFDLKNELYEHYQKLPLSFYRKNNTGDLVARISEDVSKVRMYVGPAIMYFINLSTMFILVISYMLSVSVPFTLYVLSPLPILSISIYYVSTIVEKKSDEIQRSLSSLSTFVQESFSGIRVIKSFVKEPEIVSQFTTQSDLYKEKTLSLAKVHALFMPLMVFLIGLSTLLVIYVGGLEVMEGKITTGNIAEFVIYVNMLTWPVASLGWTTSIIQRAAASQQRINEFLNQKTEMVSTENSTPILKGKITFDNVSFTYPDTGIKALKNISFEVNEGETLAILGTTGSGKSTLANLLCRMYDTTEGSILMDGINIKNINPQYYRTTIGYVPQDVFLFSDSIRNNILFGYKEGKEEDILKASKDADLYDNISDFPEKFETVIGERGITLSGGQKQRLSIARAIIRKPTLLLLDDCLSAVDTKTENAILDNLKSIMENRTSIIISHRASSVKLADKIIVLDNGEITQAGTHDELMKIGGTYKELYEKQLMGETYL